MNKILFTLGSLFLAGNAVAHPDHLSEASFGLVHFLSDPFHLMVTGLAVVLSVAVARRAVKSR